MLFITDTVQNHEFLPGLEKSRLS